jgi:hypothetical protein
LTWRERNSQEALANITTNSTFLSFIFPVLYVIIFTTVVSLSYFYEELSLRCRFYIAYIKCIRLNVRVSHRRHICNSCLKLCLARNMSVTYHQAKLHMPSYDALLDFAFTLTKKEYARPPYCCFTF